MEGRPRGRDSRCRLAWGKLPTSGRLPIGLAAELSSDNRKVLFLIKRWQAGLALILLCGAAIGVWQWRRTAVNAAYLLQCLPLDRSVQVYVDVGQLRTSGLLDVIAGSKASEESDYRSFVEQTGFDYRTDLDAVAAVFLHGDVYLAAKGRFDWKRLSKYAQAQQGQCLNDVCNMPASQPNRYISFYQVNSKVLAFAVSSAFRGVTMVAAGESKLASPVPSAPVWISAPSFTFSDLGTLPAGLHSFLSPLADARQAAFSIQPAHENGGFQLVLDAPCASPAVASAVATKFVNTTDLLRKMLARDKLTPSPADLSGVLVAGRFETHESSMTGTWPIDRRFFESLVSGKLQ